MRFELRGPQQRQHLLRHLDRLRHRIAAAADHVVFGDFHDQAALPGIIASAACLAVMIRDVRLAERWQRRS